MTKILSVHGIDPKYQHTTDGIKSAMSNLWLSQAPEKFKTAAMRVLQNAGIHNRFSVAPLEVIFSDLSFEERNQIYVSAAKEMAEKALREACLRADIGVRSIDYLITTSCTGFMIPSVDAYLVDTLKLRQDVIRIPITEMGCAGGTSAFIYAQKLLMQDPNSRVAVVCVEVPSITFQKQDFSLENAVSSAIFADGAAAAILGGSSRLAPEIIATEMYHFPNSTHYMGYNLTNSGLKIVLDKEVPDAIGAHFDHFFYPFLEKNFLSASDIQHFVFHPGGKKIIQKMEQILAPLGKDIAETKKILSSRGNLSSATVLYVLEEVMNARKPEAGETGYMLAFGPGFTAQSLLLKWSD